MDFIKEFKGLVSSKPRIAINSKSIENCAYGDYLYRCKNVYLSFFMTDAQDCYYSDFLSSARDCTDCTYTLASELCYECTDCSYLYDCSYLQDCHTCSDCNFCIDCINCKNCFGCFGLRQQEFSIFNRAYGEAAYRERVAELRKKSPTKILDLLKPEFDKHPRLYARLLKGEERCYGDYIYFSKGCFRCFNIRNVAHGGYLTDIWHPETPSSMSYDCSLCTGVHNCYECDNCSTCTNCNFCNHLTSCADMEYSMYCYNCHDCFGCIYLHGKEYCILNKQLTRDEYFLALDTIKKPMRIDGSYGVGLAEILH